MIKETVISKTNKKLWFCGKKMKQYSGFNPKNDNIYMAYVKKFKKLKSQKLAFIGDCNVDGGALQFMVDKFGSHGTWITNGTITYTGWCDKI